MCDNAATHRNSRESGKAGALSSPASVLAVACVTKPAGNGEGADYSRYVGVWTRRLVAHRRRVTPRALRIIMISAVGVDLVFLFHCVLLLPAPSHLAFAWWTLPAAVLYPYLADLPELRF